MSKKSTYKSKAVDENGLVHWTPTENTIWTRLLKSQIPQVNKKACAEYLQGLDLLNFPKDHIPQLKDINQILLKQSGWVIHPVEALIDFDTFFKLLASRRFPCATFIRTKKDFNYLPEPDIFHEIFGHCPLLTNKHFADFTARYGKLGLAATHKERIKLARLYWFTVEFGLLKKANHWKVFGGGILSSVGETHCCDNPAIEKQAFDLLTIMRTPYRIDIMQPISYYLNSLEELESLSEDVIMENVKKAIDLGLLPAKFPPKSA